MKEKKVKRHADVTPVKVLFRFLLAICILTSGAGLPAGTNGAEGEQKPEVDHPMASPKKYAIKHFCDNCGMVLDMWARTRHTFFNDESSFETCSIHCVADLSEKAGMDPRDVMAAVYLDPDKTVPASEARYVVGSSAQGTMTMESKIAFASEKEAKDFAAKYGGEVTTFQGAFEKATQQLPSAREKIAEKRLASGKIKQPGDDTHCGVCGMYPSKFPRHRTQILTADKNTIHFCSTKCLVTYLKNQEEYNKNGVKIMNTWVTLYPEGGYEHARGLYYVVGSDQHGPMGPEALPFRMRKDADSHVAAHEGVVLHFDDLDPQCILGK